MVIKPIHIKYKKDPGAQLTVISLKVHLQEPSISLTAFNGKKYSSQTTLYIKRSASQ